MKKWVTAVVDPSRLRRIRRVQRRIVRVDLRAPEPGGRGNLVALTAD